MATWQDLVNRSLVELGVVEGGEDAESHLVDEGIRIAKELLDMWSIEGFLDAGVAETEYTVPSGATSSLNVYKGTGAVSTTGLPLRFLTISYYPAGDAKPDRVLKHLDSITYFSSNFDRDQERKDPNCYFYDILKGGGGKLFFDYALPQNAKLGLIYESGHATSFTKTSDVELPIGYEYAFRLNLAVAMASGTGIKGGELSTVTVVEARQAKKELRKLGMSGEGRTIYDQGVLQNPRYGSFDYFEDLGGYF